MLTLVPTAVLLAALPVVVEAEHCPSAADIEAALSSMLPASQGGTDVARVLRREAKLRIELFNANGALVGERSLEDSGRCAELAVQAAVVIASWSSDVHPQFARPGPEPLAVAVEATAPKGRDGDSAFDLAAGASWSYAGSSALGGQIAASWLPRGAGLGIRLSVETEARRSVDFGDGKRADWRRWSGAAAADWRRQHGRISLDAHAGIASSLLQADGSGFPQNASDTSLAPGLRAGARLSTWTTRRLALWFGLEATYWLRRQRVSPTPAVPGEQVPRFSTMAVLGVAVGRAAPH